MSELFLFNADPGCLLPVIVVAGGALVCTANATTAFSWPNGAKAAVSLAYDDALPSQLDTAIPQLNAAGLKAVFICHSRQKPCKAGWLTGARRRHRDMNWVITRCFINVLNPCRAAIG